MAEVKTRTCPQCASEFEAKKPSAVYCSGKCRSAAHRVRLAQTPQPVIQAPSEPVEPHYTPNWLVACLVLLALIAGIAIVRLDTIKTQKKALVESYQDTTTALRTKNYTQQVAIDQLVQTIATHAQKADSAETLRPKLHQAVDLLPPGDLQLFLDSLFEEPAPFTPVDPQRQHSRAGAH